VWHGLLGLLGLTDLEDGTDVLSRNLNSQQPACAAQYRKLLKASTAQSQKPEI
jgi:hypothetical protein